MLIQRGSAQRSNPLPVYIPFFTKKYPFRIPSIDEWYPFHIPCLELCIPFNCCKWTVFLTGINHKNRTFSRLYKAMKFICQPFWALSQRQMTDFPTLSYTSTSKIPTLKKIPQPEAWKRYPYRPLWGVTPRGSNLLPFYIPFSTGKVPLSYTFHWKMVSAPNSHA